MLSFSGSLKVFVAVEACDLRKGFNGPHALVTERLEEGTFSWPKNLEPQTLKLKLTPQALAMLLRFARDFATIPRMKLPLPSRVNRGFAQTITATLLLSACQWTFAAEKKIVVAVDGSGDFKTLREAIAVVPDHSIERTVIRIRPGLYQGQILLPATKSKITFEGEDLTNTVLTYALNQNEPVPAGQSDKYKGAAVVILGDDFMAEKITFQNTSGDHGQAMALRTYGDRAVIRHCRLLGWQDTLLTASGRQYFRECYIEGRVDFIYGPATVVFDRCEIHSKNGGYVTAASTPQDHPFGYVFMNCKLTGEGRPAFLGRPWRPFASVTYLNCELGAHIRPEGWDNWRNPDNEKTARYAEFNSTGPGASPSQRVAWSKQLTKDEAAKITVSAVLGGADHWNPGQ